MKSTYYVKPGDLLVAPPQIQDPRFEKSVIFLTNTGRYSTGFCVNKRTEYTISDILLDSTLSKEIPIYWGGPTSLSTVWMLHTNDWQYDNTIMINNNWSLTSHIHMFEAMEHTNYPKKLRVFLGHVIWLPGQLELELEGNNHWHPTPGWLKVTDPDPNWLFTCKNQDLWRSCTRLCSKQSVDQWMT